MKKQISINLDENIYNALMEKFQGDKDAIDQFAAKALMDSLATSSKEEGSPETPSETLEDYLKKGNTSDRNYGIKGQGW